MKILVVTDAWKPQTNGVVRTYESISKEMPALGVEMEFLTPKEFKTIPCPTYPQIRLAVSGFKRAKERIEDFKPDAIHIATEGPIGWWMRRYCLKRSIPFTTAFHTRFPEYIQKRFFTPVSLGYWIERIFHNKGEGIMVASQSLGEELKVRGFEKILPWTRGVDTELFRPQGVRLFGEERPVLLFVGRVAVEKNLEAFLELKVEGKKIVVGSGPALDELHARYPDVVFTGKKQGEQLARAYASADVFVFPSRTDTFGVVLLEAMASGVPVAAFPVTGPKDIVKEGVVGYCDEDLGRAIDKALKLDRGRVREEALSYSWKNTAEIFVSNIEKALFQDLGREAPVRFPRS